MVIEYLREQYLGYGDPNDVCEFEIKTLPIDHLILFLPWEFFLITFYNIIKDWNTKQIKPEKVLQVKVPIGEIIDLLDAISDNLYMFTTWFHLTYDSNNHVNRL